MQESFSPEQAPQAETWEGTLNAVITAHKAFMDDHDNGEKLSVFQAAFDTALAQAATTDEMGELIHHVPVDQIDDYHSSATDRIQKKWGELSDKELENAKDLMALQHAYDNAPFDDHREKALKKLIDAIREKDALRIHHDAGAATPLALAIEQKFPALFAKREGSHAEAETSDDGGMYDMKAEGETETGIMEKIRKVMGIE